MTHIGIILSLTLNIPSFSSVLRYGFRSPPHLELKARPKLGEREVTLVHVTDWIERKLEQEFQVYSGKKQEPGRMQTVSLDKFVRER